MNKEKVLIVHNYYQVPGGEDIVVLNEKKMLEDNGHKVVLYTRHNDEIKEMGILSKLIIPFRTIYSFKSKKEIKKLIKEENINIVHVHNTFPLISPSVYSIGKKSKVKVIQTVHNFRLLCPAATFVRDNKICEDCVNKGLISSVKHNCYRNSKIQTTISAITLKFNRIIGSYKKIDSYIALTEFNKNKLSYLINKEKIYVKPNYCGKLDIPICNINERKYFIYLGRLDKLKGINLIVEAWKNIKNEELIIVGTGPEEKNLKNFVKNNNIDNVKFLGYKEKNEAMELLSKSKALLFPTQWYEPFGLVMIEALKLGIPVIANKIGSIPEIINSEKLGIVKSINSAKDIEDLILEFLNKYSQYKNIDKLFLDRYNIKENYSILKNIYDI